MNRKLDWPALFLFTALLFGAVVRFWPVIATGFPLNDGGMFHTMIQDLKSNHYRLPHYTTYNHADIPFAYPPLGFYIAASVSDLFRLPVLTVLRWLPALVNTVSIFFFYKLARHILRSRMLASLAVLVYAFSPRAFMWQVMGGGITRAFGLLFLLLMLWQAVQMFRDYKFEHLALTVLFGSGAVLSHPQTALHAVLGGVLIFAFYGRNKRGVFSAVLTGFGVALLTAPWWGLVLGRHGLDPVIFAGQTSQRTLDAFLAILSFNGLTDYLFVPTLLLALLGSWIVFSKREFLLIVWVVLAYLIDPRGAEGIMLLSLSMLAGMGLHKLSARIGRPGGVQEEDALEMNGSPKGAVGIRPAQILIFSLAIYFVLVASMIDFQLINTSLKPSDLALIGWVKTNVPDDKTFLLATGRQFSMSDPLQEWFPALAGQRSVTTMQGLEWTLGDGFFSWYDQVIAFQYCADITCVQTWSVRNDVDYDYLIVLIPPERDKHELANSLRSLGASVRSSTLYAMVYASESAFVFELNK